MHLVDHIFVLLIFVAMPIYSALDSSRYIARRVEVGKPSNCVRFCRETAIFEWVFLAALVIVWFTLGRHAEDLGFVMLDGVELWGGVAVFVLLVGVLLNSWRFAKRASADVKEKLADSFGKLAHFLPSTRRDLRYFVGLSITAGIVEEIVYRGFLLWYLRSFMPLWVAVTVSSVAFGLWHSEQGAGGVLRTGLVGLAFAIYYVFTGSLWLPIIAHIVFDILQSVTIVEILRKDDDTAPPTTRGTP